MHLPRIDRVHLAELCRQSGRELFQVPLVVRAAPFTRLTNRARVRTL